jgi:flavin-dependent dehydrogenase
MGTLTHFDVLIVGAGVSGSLLAACLAAGGQKVLVLEQASLDRPKHGEFLSSQAATAIEKLQVLQPGWRDDHSLASEFLSSWGGAASSKDFIFDPFGRATVLDRTRFDQSLARSAQSRGAQIRMGARVVAADRSTESWSVSYTEYGRLYHVTASFLAVCGGRNGWLPKTLSLRRRRADKLICLGMRISSYYGDVRAAVEAFDQGWVYSIGLPSGHLMLNLLTESDTEHRRRISKSIDFFLSEVSKCPIAASRVLQTSPKSAEAVTTFVADASSCWTRPAVGPGWCLAGDQAQSMDPLSSSGIAHAVEHATRISHALLACESPAFATLEDYASYLDRSYRTYLTERNAVYKLEHRWLTSFWRRRWSALHFDVT